ncbi:hypothetical protein KIK84_11540 [Curvibacter sp. CHRR-16]|uniref:hypothetical protein n=1 Tax=Curvibacter sp. CHRR-16 TaxID=2835872 RepID=UPI001BDA1C37|nr:hypothetical protein [Curvibacter sp. CHRR-16]MBT0570965.1 hypothetical protein [Curvibacter sp. CHRR-16]
MRAVRILGISTVGLALALLSACSSTPKQVRPSYLLSQQTMGSLSDVGVLLNAYRTPEAKAAQDKARKERPLFKRDTDEERNMVKAVDASLFAISRMDDVESTQPYPLALDRHGRTMPYLLLTPGIYRVTVHCKYADLFAYISTLALVKKGHTTTVSCTLKDEATKPVFKAAVADPEATAPDLLSMPVHFY